MRPDSNARSHYLALALDTRVVIDSLVEFIDQGVRQTGFDDALQQVLDSVKSALGPESGSSQLRHIRLAENYEQMQTWDEVLSQEDRQKMVEKLQSVKADKGDLEAQKNDAFEVLELLSRIENRALYNYRPQNA